MNGKRISGTNKLQTAVLSEVPTELLIGNSWRQAEGGQTFEVDNPATGGKIATVASAAGSDAVAALDAACDAQNSWAATSPRRRSEILYRAFQLVVERSEKFASLMTMEMGKPIEESRAEVRYAAEFLRWYSEEAVRLYGRSYQAPEGTLRMLTVRKPVGPCLLITPWNFPLAMATRKVAPAVAAGCTMVLKPAKLTPLSALYFGKTMLEAGLPPGVLNVIPSSKASEVSNPLLQDSRLRKLSFTGSTQVGRVLLKAASQNVLRTSMELGGNAPFLVFEDADLDVAVDGAVAAKMRNMGEACTAANRFIVHEAVAQEFSEGFARRMSAMNVGNGLDSAVDCGPLIDRSALDNVSALVEEAVSSGARPIAGGQKLDREGFFFQPTVLVDVPRDARVLCEEIFGPVAPIVTFATESEAVSLANATEYGLASYIFTTDLARVWRLSEGLEFGLMGVNTGAISNAAAPFGGMKQSGMGREGGVEGIEEYTTLQYVGIRDPYA